MARDFLDLFLDYATAVARSLAERWAEEFPFLASSASDVGELVKLDVEERLGNNDWPLKHKDYLDLIHKRSIYWLTHLMLREFCQDPSTSDFMRRRAPLIASKLQIDQASVFITLVLSHSNFE